MSGTKIDRRAGLLRAAARQDHKLIARAAKRTDWAGTVLEGAAGDLGDAHGDDGKALTGLAEVVLEQAARVSHLAEDIESHGPVPEDAPNYADVLADKRSTARRP
jgi:hypothetical protein